MAFLICICRVIDQALGTLRVLYAVGGVSDFRKKQVTLRKGMRAGPSMPTKKIKFVRAATKAKWRST